MYSSSFSARYAGGQMMIEQTAAESDVSDADGFCRKIALMVEMARDTPTFFDQIGACISLICNAACDHRVKVRGLRLKGWGWGWD